MSRADPAPDDSSSEMRIWRRSAICLLRALQQRLYVSPTRDVSPTRADKSQSRRAGRMAKDIVRVLKEIG